MKYHKKFLSLNALIITPAPTEINKGSELNDMVLQENNIIIVSKQLLDDYVFEKKVEVIVKLNLDFIVFDENHFHETTQMSKNILQTYSCEKTVKLYVTATYSKPLHEWNNPSDCQFYWDIEDEQLCKKGIFKN